jgi:hypothetical protein
MKKTLLAIFAICLLQAGLLGCLGSGGITIIEDDPIRREPFYINNSGVTVKLTVGEYEQYTGKYEQEVKNNDTLWNDYLDKNGSNVHWRVPYGGEYDDYITPFRTSEPMYFKVEFLSDPKVCLIFDGDARIGENDIRYWENYTLVEKRKPVNHFYSYTITPELREQAREEYCGE